MNSISINSTPTLGGKLEFAGISERSHPSVTERSPLPRLIKKRELTAALEWLETKEVRGEGALFAIALTQDLMRRGVKP